MIQQCSHSGERGREKEKGWKQSSHQSERLKQNKRTWEKLGSMKTTALALVLHQAKNTKTACWVPGLFPTHCSPHVLTRRGVCGHHLPCIPWVSSQESSSSQEQASALQYVFSANTYSWCGFGSRHFYWKLRIHTGKEHTQKSARLETLSTGLTPYFLSVLPLVGMRFLPCALSFDLGTNWSVFLWCRALRPPYGFPCPNLGHLADEGLRPVFCASSVYLHTFFTFKAQCHLQPRKKKKWSFSPGKRHFSQSRWKLPSLSSLHKWQPDKSLIISICPPVRIGSVFLALLPTLHLQGWLSLNPCAHKGQRKSAEAGKKKEKKRVIINSIQEIN